MSQMTQNFGEESQATCNAPLTWAMNSCTTSSRTQTLYTLVSIKFEVSGCALCAAIGTPSWNVAPWFLVLLPQVQSPLFTFFLAKRIQCFFVLKEF